MQRKETGLLILAFESTALTASAALWQDGAPLASTTLTAGNTHSTTLLPLAEHLLSMSGKTVNDIDLFACAVGPGSFTGVRIGAATVQGLAFEKNKPCVGVSSLLGMAYALRGFTGILCPVISARRSQFYSALFSSDGEHVRRLTEDSIVLTEDLDTYLAPYDAPIHLIGDGYKAALSAITHPKLCMTPQALQFPSAFAVAEAAFDLYTSAEDKSVFTPSALTPVYLKKTQAEQEREERLAAKAVQDTKS